jgi:hypothetical protein
MNDKFPGEENLLGSSFAGRNCQHDVAFLPFLMQSIVKTPRRQSSSLNKTTQRPSKHLPQYKLQHRHIESHFRNFPKDSRTHVYRVMRL